MLRSKPTGFGHLPLGITTVLPLAFVLAACSDRNSCEGPVYLSYSAADAARSADPSLVGGLQADPYAGSTEAGYFHTDLRPTSFVPVSELRRDDYSYGLALTRINEGYLPPPYGVKIPRFVASFEYGYPGPEGGELVAGATAITQAPWRADHLLARIHLKAKPLSVLGGAPGISGSAPHQPLVTNAEVRVTFDARKIQAYRMIGVDNASLGAAYASPGGGELIPGEEITILFELVPVETAGESVVRAPFYSVLVSYEDAITRAVTSLGLTASDTSYTNWESSPSDFKFAAAAAAFGMILAESPYRGGSTFDAVIGWATQGLGEDSTGERREMIELVEAAKAAKAWHSYPEQYGYYDDMGGICW